MYDCIIIGAGPAGIAAGIATARKKYKTLVVAKKVGSGLDEEEYLGFSRNRLTEHFRRHLQVFKETLELREGEEVVNLEKNFTSFQVELKNGEQFFSRSAIIASGKIPELQSFPGESDFYGDGIFTCENFDALQYKNKSVVVVGSGEIAMDAMYLLSKFAKKIYSVNEATELSGNSILKQKVESKSNISFINQAVVTGVTGKHSVEFVRVQRSTGRLEVIDTHAVFVETSYASSSVFDRLTNKTNKGKIKVNGNLETSIPGIFSAGDCNDSESEGVMLAAGEGVKAGLSATRYLNRLK